MQCALQVWVVFIVNEAKMLVLRQTSGCKLTQKVVNSLMKQAGIEGKFTNHSLRATTATHMFQKGVDEQLIKCVTGHKSDAVRLYKRPSDKLIQSAC